MHRIEVLKEQKFVIHLDFILQETQECLCRTHNPKEWMTREDLWW